MQEGEVYSVKVVKLLDYGAFVELPNGFQALLHISELSHSRVSLSDLLLHFPPASTVTSAWPYPHVIG